MYYVAKRENQFTLNIVESFDDFELAQQYANVMNRANKGEYVILTVESKS